jgi:hypothetical protein
MYGDKLKRKIPVCEVAKAILLSSTFTVFLENVFVSGLYKAT